MRPCWSSPREGRARSGRFVSRQLESGIMHAAREKEATIREREGAIYENIGFLI